MSLSMAALMGTLSHNKACIHQAIRVCVSPAVQLNLFQGNVLKCLPPASKQASHFQKIFLNTRQSASLEILELSLLLVFLCILVSMIVSSKTKSV